jgi:hypothetical protein
LKPFFLIFFLSFIFYFRSVCLGASTIEVKESMHHTHTVSTHYPMADNGGVGMNGVIVTKRFLLIAVQLILHSHFLAYLLSESRHLFPPFSGNAGSKALIHFLQSTGFVLNSVPVPTNARL